MEEPVAASCLAGSAVVAVEIALLQIVVVEVAFGAKVLSELALAILAESVRLLNFKAKVALDKRDIIADEFVQKLCHLRFMINLAVFRLEKVGKLIPNILLLLLLV